MPETYHSLRRLGVIDALRHSPLPRKIGVQFIDENGRASKPFLFQQHDPSESSCTWHVERAHFDKLLFDNAAKKGAQCLDQTRVTHVQLNEQSPHHARAQTATGESFEIEASVVIDATGQQSLLANQLGLKQVNPSLRKAAIWGHFQVPDQGLEEGTLTTIIHGESKNVWFWHIPVAEDRVSVGLVGDRDFLFDSSNSPQEIFEQHLSRCRGLSDFRSQAKPAGPIRVAREFSYTSSRHAGPGWVLIGDAFGFLDPIYSTGVFLALKSGELAADAVVAGLTDGDLSAARLGGWMDDFKSGVTRFRQLVDAFYTNEFSFSKFLAKYPGHERNLTDLLIGRAFQPGVEQLCRDLENALAASKARTDPIGVSS